MYRPLLCLLLLYQLTAAEPTIGIVVDRDHAAVGDTLTVSVELGDSGSFAHWGVLLRYDPTVLRLDSQAAGDIDTFVADSRSLAEIAASGEIRSGGLSLAGDRNPGSGTLLRAGFTVIGGDGSTTELSSVAASAAEPFGAVLIAADGTRHLPLIGPAAVVSIGSATPSDRRISLTLTSAGVPRPVLIEATPDHASGSGDAPTVFDGLDPETSYVFDFTPVAADG